MASSNNQMPEVHLAMRGISGSVCQGAVVGLRGGRLQLCGVRATIVVDL